MVAQHVFGARAVAAQEGVEGVGGRWGEVEGGEFNVIPGVGEVIAGVQEGWGGEAHYGGRRGAALGGFVWG